MNPSPIFDLWRPNPLLIVISGPSGVGKDTVLQGLKARGLPFHFVVTATSRAPRPGEAHGRDYFFYSQEVFESMIERGELIEHAWVYGQYKGIPRSQVDEALASGQDTILRVDVQGAEKVRSLYPQALLIFLVPASEEEWLARLRDRATETEDTLRIRVETVHSELDKISLFDYIVVNAQDCLDETLDAVQAIICAEHHRIPHRRINP